MAARLFPDTLSVARDGGAVDGKRSDQPACKPRWLITGDGSRFVGKLVGEPSSLTGSVSPLRALTEFAAAHWAVAFGVHAPESRFLDFDGELWIGSRALASPRPASPAAVAAVTPPEAVSGLLALDVFIGNHDRHDGNVLFVPEHEGGSALRLFAIDHERSAMGLQDIEEDFTETYAAVTMFHAVLRPAVRRSAAVAAARQARVVLGQDDRLRFPLISGNMWCKVDISLLASMEAVLAARLERLANLVDVVCERLKVAE